MTMPDEIRAAARTVAVPHHEGPSVVRRRRLIVGVVLLLGAFLLGYSLRSRPGDESFYVSALSLGAVWLGGTLLSGPLFDIAMNAARAFLTSGQIVAMLK